MSATTFLVVLMVAAACSTASNAPVTTAPASAPSADAPIASASPSPRSTDPALFAHLEARSLALPAGYPAGSCPVSQGRKVSPFYFTALGGGPIHWIGGSEYALGGARKSDGYVYGKVLWIADPTYRGRAVIRGLRIDGPGDVRFDEGAGSHPTVLYFPIDTGTSSDGAQAGFRDRPSSVGIQTAGCYAFQIDGDGFRSQIVVSLLL